MQYHFFKTSTFENFDSFYISSGRDYLTGHNERFITFKIKIYDFRKICSATKVSFL